MSTLPYGPNTAAVRGFLVRLAGLGTDSRGRVVTQHAALAHTRAYEAADSTLGETITRSGREDARNALFGPLVQLLKRPTAAPEPGQEPTLEPAPAPTSHADDDIELDPIAEPALAALLALLVGDLLDAETRRVLTASFDGVMPVSDGPVTDGYKR